MSKVYPPSEVRQWTLQQMRDLAGKYVIVEVWASQSERDWYESDWIGGEGFVSRGGRRASTDLSNEPKDVEDGPVWWVLWDYGMGWQWNKDAEVYVSVCEGNGHSARHEPFTESVQNCRAQMGVRGNTLEAAREKYGE